MYSWHAEFPINTPLTPPPPSTPSSPQTLPHPHPPTPHAPSAPSQHSSQNPCLSQKTVRNLLTSPPHPASSPISSSYYPPEQAARNQMSADRGKGTIFADGLSGWSLWLRGRRLRNGFVRLMGVRLGGWVALAVGRWYCSRWCYHCCDGLARCLAHLMRKAYLPSDNLASRNHLSAASCALAVKIANGGYGTGGGGGRGCSLGVNGCRGDEGGFPALYVNSERKGRIVESRRTFLKAWWSFELSSDVVDGWWLSDDEECESSVSVWFFWSR